MASVSQFRSLGKFLYTQNPFYLISCFLVLYGFQQAAFSDGDLFSRSLIFSVSIAAYLLLMAVTCIGVVRFGKIWDDGRSIFLVVIISQVALSTSLDELCISQWNAATGLMLMALGFSIAITETVLRVCRVQLRSWYRVSFYALMLVFFLMPILLGRAVGERQLTLTNWGAPLFSTLVGIALLLMIPAIRKGAKFVANNGTPWQWPLYPLSAFAILIVLAAIRAHAIWMSFGFIGAPVQFEAFLLLPIALAVLVLFVESDSHSPQPVRAYWAMGLAPLLLLCGIGNEGMTNLPIRFELSLIFGSAQTLVLVCLVTFYVYTWTKGLWGSTFALTTTLMAMCVLSDLPQAAQDAGVHYWMLGLCASLIALAVAVMGTQRDYQWLVFSIIATITILMAGDAYQDMSTAGIASGVFAIAACMTIGACFTTELATLLRQVSAFALSIAGLGFMGWHLSRNPANLALYSLAGLALLSLVYLLVVRRKGWLLVLASQSLCLLAVFCWNLIQSGASGQLNWSLQSGLLCFVIGVTITTVKSGAHQHLRRGLPKLNLLGNYQNGF